MSLSFPIFISSTDVRVCVLHACTHPLSFSLPTLVKSRELVEYTMHQQTYCAHTRQPLSFLHRPFNDGGVGTWTARPTLVQLFVPFFFLLPARVLECWLRSIIIDWFISAHLILLNPTDIDWYATDPNGYAPREKRTTTAATVSSTEKIKSKIKRRTRLMVGRFNPFQKTPEFVS